MTKLTLSMDETVVAKAKRHARRRGTSVSAMITDFIISLPDGRRKRIPIGPLTRKALGIARFASDKDDKELLEEAIWERHGVSK
jgi:hypothetical protein